MPSTGAAFTLRGVEVVLQGHPVLSDIELCIGPGEQVALVGPSGAGKTSLLRLLNAVLWPSRGEVCVDGSCLTGFDPRRLRQLRSRIGFVHQGLDLVPNLRVAQNVLAGRLGSMGFLRSVGAMLRPPRRELLRVHEILERVGIPEKTFERTDRLSGGERQRVAIARALYQDARALLVDEPVSSLDPERARDTFELLLAITSESGLTLIASTHDLELARRCFPRLIGIRAGRIAFDRRPGELAPEEIEALYRLDSVEASDDGASREG
ncbi:MAG: ATP-binding cassette domain-containing protein [Planctomycetes bacterium]|nr:ATP-binding cassette domain-containing protein [Planctomycetota bacterium]MCB9887930.1 ATP-binding cassette domain-containing protein [Planctomycetota bacterium]